MMVIEGKFPPGLDSPLLYLTTIFFMLLGALLCAEWLYRTLWKFIEQPAGLRTPTFSLRLAWSLMLGAILVRSVPRLWLFMRWPVLSPEQRYDLFQLAAQSEVVSVVLFFLAWLLALLGEPMISFQLRKQPLPMHLWPTMEQLKRPAKIIVGVFVIAFALTYLR